MDAETLIWTLILFGGTVLTFAWLCYIAWHRGQDRTDDVEQNGMK